MMKRKLTTICTMLFMGFTTAWADTSVISEGVEQQDQLDTLKAIGCDYVQGFIWGRPLSPEDARKVVLDSFQSSN